MYKKPHYWGQQEYCESARMLIKEKDQTRNFGYWL